MAFADARSGHSERCWFGNCASVVDEALDCTDYAKEVLPRGLFSCAIAQAIEVEVGMTEAQSLSPATDAASLDKAAFHL